MPHTTSKRRWVEDNLPKEKAIMIGKDGKRREVDMKLSPKAQAEFDVISKKVTEDLRPMYESMGVNIDTEELHWTNGEVFVVNKATRIRREILGSQINLNRKMMANAIELAKKSRT